jgi:hypothetical protein
MPLVPTYILLYKKKAKIVLPEELSESERYYDFLFLGFDLDRDFDLFFDFPMNNNYFNDK